MSFRYGLDDNAGCLTNDAVNRHFEFDPLFVSQTPPHESMWYCAPPH